MTTSISSDSNASSRPIHIPTNSSPSKRALAARSGNPAHAYANSSQLSYEDYNKLCDDMVAFGASTSTVDKVAWPAYAERFSQRADVARSAVALRARALKYFQRRAERHAELFQWQQRPEGERGQGELGSARECSLR